MIDINYGDYTLFQYLIIAFTLFPIEIIHSWLIVRQIARNNLNEFNDVN